jgi:hypothetical protein
MSQLEQLMKPETTLLPADWTVPAKLRARLGTMAGRQRMLDADGHIVLVLHAPPSADEVARRGRFFWRDPQGNWRAAPKGERVAKLDDHLNEYRAEIEELEEDEDKARGARDYFELLDRLEPLSRAIRNMHETLQKARETQPDDRDLIVARDAAYDLMRRADILHNDTKNGLEFAIAWQAEQQAESSYQMSVATHRLNLLVAFFFPIATATAIFGANLKHGLEKWDATSSPLPLLVVLGAGLVAGLVLTSFVARPTERPKRDIQSSPSKPSTKRAK